MTALIESTVAIADKPPEPVGGMLAGSAFKAPPDPVEPPEDPHQLQRAMAHALRTKPTPEGS
jgi:hypothetical protein